MLRSARAMHGGSRMPGMLIVAAHPDDETIGAGALLAGSDDVTVLHVTDGAPRDRRWWSAGAAGSRADYARARRDEVEHALELAGVPRSRVHDLGLVDQEACQALPELAAVLAHWIERVAPALVVTHAYEGGHPDHDAVAFAVAVARVLVARAGHAPPMVFEMALYHGAAGGFHVGEFVPVAGGRTAIARPLAAAERTRRREMLACFTTQQATLAPFVDVGHERYRPAPAYEFTRPPHAGPLLYERSGFGIDGDAWRHLASRALSQVLG